MKILFQLYFFAADLNNPYEYNYEIDECLLGYQKLLEQGYTLFDVFPLLNREPHCLCEILTLLKWGHEFETLKFFLEWRIFDSFSLALLSDNS